MEQLNQLSLEYLWEHLPITNRRKRLSKKILSLI